MSRRNDVDPEACPNCGERCCYWQINAEAGPHMTSPASPPVAVGVDWLEVYAAVRPVLDRHPMIDSSTAHKLDIQAGWIVDALRALASPVSGDGPSADADTHRAPVPPVVGWQDISTAPRDGTVFMVTGDDYDWPEIVRWEIYDPEAAEMAGDVGYWAYAEPLLNDVTDSPGDEEWTHWMPLPPPPAASRSPGMETLQASECTQPQALALIPQAEDQPMPRAFVGPDYASMGLSRGIAVQTSANQEASVEVNQKDTPDREQALGGWQTIDTAPRDGTWVLACWTDAMTAVFGVVMWDGDYWRENDDIVKSPTHWMPLPPAPDTVSTNEVRD